MADAYPENVDGDFYVEAGCCTCCDVPLTEAPDLFAYADDGDGYMHCYVAKQPANESELDDMLRVIACAELGCIHYRGNDSNLLERLADLGESEICDAVAPNAGEPKRRWWHFW